MSADLQWLLLRKWNSFQHKSGNGPVLSREKVSGGHSGDSVCVEGRGGYSWTAGTRDRYCQGKNTAGLETTCAGYIGERRNDR